MAEQETIFERWAKERNITVEEMKAILSARIEQDLNAPDSKKRAQWEKIPHAGKIPTPEEWKICCNGIRIYDYSMAEVKWTSYLGKNFLALRTRERGFIAIFDRIC